MSERAYDFLVVGAGLFGSVVAHEATRVGKRVLVVDRRDHLGGNCWSFQMAGVEVHAYGPHVLHTDDKVVWDWLNSFSEFSPCMMSPIANFRGELYNLPFNMNTFHQLWGVSTPAEAMAKIEEQRVPCEYPRNLEEHVLSMVGCDVYEKLVKGYTEKQYGKPCADLPASIISRMPLRFVYDNDYSRVRYQGVPMGGWNLLFERMLRGIEVRLEVDFLVERDSLERLADVVVFTGPIDEYYGYRYGALEYRGRRFEHHIMDCENWQGISLMNYTDSETPQLRTIEHRHFIDTDSDKTVVTTEYAIPWVPGDEPYYTVNDEVNQARYERYLSLAGEGDGVCFGGRLGEYQYYDMQDTVKSAWRLCDRLLGEQR